MVLLKYNGWLMNLSSFLLCILGPLCDSECVSISEWAPNSLGCTCTERKREISLFNLNWSKASKQDNRLLVCSWGERERERSKWTRLCVCVELYFLQRGTWKCTWALWRATDLLTEYMAIKSMTIAPCTSLRGSRASIDLMLDRYRLYMIESMCADPHQNRMSSFSCFSSVPLSVTSCSSLHLYYHLPAFFFLLDGTDDLGGAHRQWWASVRSVCTPYSQYTCRLSPLRCMARAVKSFKWTNVP